MVYVQRVDITHKRVGLLVDCLADEKVDRKAIGSVAGLVVVWGHESDDSMVDEKGVL